MAAMARAYPAPPEVVIGDTMISKDSGWPHLVQLIAEREGHRLRKWSRPREDIDEVPRRPAEASHTVSKPYLSGNLNLEKRSPSLT